MPPVRRAKNSQHSDSALDEARDRAVEDVGRRQLAAGAAAPRGRRGRHGSSSSRAAVPVADRRRVTGRLPRRSGSATTTTDAIRFVPSVRTKSTSPAAMRPETVNASAAGALRDEARDGRAAVLQDLVADDRHLRQQQHDRDRLAERAPEAEHRAADDPAPAVGEHDRADHPPAGAAERERGFLLPRRRLREHLADDRRSRSGRPSATRRCRR